MPPDSGDEQPTLFSGSGDEPTVSLPGGENAARGTPASGPQLQPGQRFGPYQIHRPLGRGGMGEVYEAVHLESGHRVALKLLAAESSWSEERRKRFLREGRLAASVNHPHSLYIYGTEEIEGIPVISMELATGATLKDRVDSAGPLASGLAVVAALQMIDGLQAAEKEGVLHRDIKPANCFVDHDGNVKIGDFGLATSSGGEEMSQLTAPGTILGTPAYAAPEQLRGDPVDVRSDIYAVGGTLYFLLTGKPPFPKEAGLQLMAAILEKTPVAPRQIQRGIPAGLSRLVLRCLEKDPSARPPSYEKLRSLLEPFGSHALPSAGPARRLTAGFLDYVWIQVLLPVVAYYPLMSPTGDVERSLPSGLWELPLIAIGVLVAGVLEGIWGVTPGKWLAGIRVWGARKAAPGIRTALIRGAIFWAPLIAIDLLRFLLWRFAHVAQGSPVDLTLDAVGDVSMLGHFLWARRATGWRAAHDQLTGTRVVRKLASETLPEFDAASGAESQPTGEARLGPYTIPGDAIPAKAGDIVPGFDPALRRKVWILFRGAGSPTVSETRRTLPRRGRLRWLNGRRTAEGAWDAYQAVEGSPFARVTRKTQSWAVVRQWICDLAEELHLCADEDPATQPALSLDRVWITTEGRALLLDFPAPDGVVASDPSESSEAVRTFLARVAHGALSGGHARDLPPLPVHAHRFLRSLENDPATDRETTHARARELLTRPANLTWKRRLGQMVLPLSPLLLVALLMLVGGIVYNQMTSRDYPDLSVFNASLERLHEMETDERIDAQSTAEKRSLEILLAGPFRDSILGEKPIPRTAMQFPNLGAAERATLERIFAAHPDPTVEEIEGARQQLEPFLQENQTPRSLGTLIPAVLKGFGGVACLGILLLAPLSLLLGLIVPGGLAQRIVGVAVVTANGERASRIRCLERGLIAWFPALMLWVFFLTRRWEESPLVSGGPIALARSLGQVIRAASDAGVLPVAAGLFLVGAVWVIVRPSRGPQDLVTRTHVVPE